MDATFGETLAAGRRGSEREREREREREKGHIKEKINIRQSE